MDIKADHVEEGFEIAGPFASCDGALTWAEHERPDVALVDFKLKDGPCTETCVLLKRGVPVVIYSGCQGEGTSRHTCGM